MANSANKNTQNVRKTSTTGQAGSATKGSASITKTKRRMKKQVRKTLGGLFMASAIVVAAIPVQDIKAVEIPGVDDSARKKVNYDYKPSRDDLNLDPNDYLTPPEGEKNKSYVVRELTDKTWSYNWQYEYYVTTVDGGNVRAIISQYNSIYPETEVILGNSATVGYVTVKTEDYNDFMSNEEKGAKTTTVNYDVDYLPIKTSSTKTDAIKWFEKYILSEYEPWYQACENYYDYINITLPNYTYEHDEWQRKKNEHDLDPENYPDPGPEPQAPTVIVKPGDLSKAPKDFDDLNDRYMYYCSECSKLPSSDEHYIPGEGYTLEAVRDNVSEPDGSGKAQTIYICRNGSPVSPAYNDSNGFLVKDASIEIIGISKAIEDPETHALKGAFAGISNVDILTLPEELRYIGDGAFADSFIKVINLKNVENIGNYAFRDCTELADVTMSATKKIGAESFKNIGIDKVVFPYSLSEIGYGAFAECRKLNTIDINNVNTACEIHDYAFYNDYALNDVAMQQSAVSNIGEGAFSLVSAPTGSWKAAYLPDQITGGTGSELGDLLFAGRNNLEYVKFPTNYGTNTSVTVPSSTFKNCTNLNCVDFTAEKGSIIDGYANFEGTQESGFKYNNLFYDVANPDFYVKGPEKNNGGEKSYPRQSTWQAYTQVSNYVPYVYVNAQGIECYEISDGTYLLQANEKGELTSCELVDQKSSEPIDLVIPKTVGDYEVKTIANGCFDNEKLRNRIRSITIVDDSLIGLDDQVFANLPNLEEVYIGNSVSSIGDRAFENCPKLENVYFNTPSVGYSGFTIGKDAFKTDSQSLTLHGDIIPGYAPFDFATGKDSGKIDDMGKRICYMSQSPSFLTCMYDNATNEVVLLDYPKYKELDDRNASHNKQMEDTWTKKCAGGSYDNDRNAFYDQWRQKEENGEDPTTLYGTSYDGPWISKSSFEAYVAKYNADHAEDPGFVPYAPGEVKPLEYYSPGRTDKNKYSILENYENPGNTPWRQCTEEEQLWILGCVNIVIPDGITSIDATSFFNAPENTRNVSTYFGPKTSGNKSYEMCTNNHGMDDVVPGLFSGYYEDYDEGDPSASEYEKEIKGNDRIESISMSSVKALPDYAFDSCERLNHVDLGPELADMGTAPFRGCGNMDDMTGNDHFVTDNRIIYTVNPDGSYTIKECLPSRGKDPSSKIIDSSIDPAISKVTGIENGAFEECDYITRVNLTDSDGLEIVPEKCFNNCDKLVDVKLPKTISRIEDYAFGNLENLTVRIPAIEVDILTDAFEHSSSNTIETYENSAAYDYAKYFKLHWEPIDKLYDVEFVDWDGTTLALFEDVEEGKAVVPPADPVRKDYIFKGWNKNDYLNVQEDLLILAVYDPISGNQHKISFINSLDDTVITTQMVNHGDSVTFTLPAPNVSGYTFTKWSPSSLTNITKDETVLALYDKIVPPAPAPTGSSSPSPSGSTSPTPTPSPTNSPGGDSGEAKTYTVTVSGGSGSGSYPAGAIVGINAYDMGTGQTFDKWTTSTAGVGFADATSTSTFFTMPAANVAITATYKTGGADNNNQGGNNNGGNGNGGNNGNTSNPSGTRVDINKNGISNKGVAGATVSGSTDNFVVKITDDASAAQLAQTALQNAFGANFADIKYFPFDISLYDESGTTKIADTSGMSVNITMPLPDELATYAGNNKVASVLGGELEPLNSRFTTVDGVPCISFTATHFSPYVIYVDTKNLTESTIDYTPKTGDPIHPKWFLAIGLAAISLILFFKKDKRVPLKAA